MCGQCARGPPRAARAAPPFPAKRLLWCAVLALPRGTPGFRLGAAADSLRRGAAALRGGLASGAAGGSRASAAGSGPNFSDVEDFQIPVCDCTCCVVLERPLAEIHEETGALLKCAIDEAGPGHPVVKRVPAGHSGEMMASDFECPGPTHRESQRCLLDTGLHAQASATVLDTSGRAGTDYNRFCFFQCQPRDFAKGNPCVPIGLEAANLSMTPHGNGRDPGLHPQTAGAGPLVGGVQFYAAGGAAAAAALPLAGPRREGSAALAGRGEPPPTPSLAQLRASQPPELVGAPLSAVLRAIAGQRFTELLDQEIQQFPWLTGVL